jgi:hypothetical protein
LLAKASLRALDGRAAELEGTRGNGRELRKPRRLEKVAPMSRWRVDIIRKRAEHLGIVTAPNAQEALARAASLFRIKPARYDKLMITKIDELSERDYGSSVRPRC